MFVDTDRINHDLLEKIAREDVLAVRVRNFIPSFVAERLSDQIVRKGVQSYINAPSIGRIGMAFYEAENNASLMDEYFNSVFENINELRSRCAPYASPIDVLRCVLDEVWPAGAKLETLYGKKMYVGLSRVVEPGVVFLAHHDIFYKDAPDSFRARSLLAQMAANVYIAMPSRGGALQIWDDFISPDKFDQMRGDCYGIDPKLLGSPAIEICPNVGDLIVFDSKRMHAVTAGEGGIRLSLSCFVGYRGSFAPLSLWS